MSNDMTIIVAGGNRVYRCPVCGYEQPQAQVMDSNTNPTIRLMWCQKCDDAGNEGWVTKPLKSTEPT